MNENSKDFLIVESFSVEILLNFNEKRMIRNG
jgi:hypothetical protein